MRIIAVLGLALCLASCYAATEVEAPRLSTSDVAGRRVAVAPTKGGPSNPAVVTSRGVLAYDRDLQSCRGVAGREDDVAALQRAIAERPLGGSVSATYRSGDVALDRDRVVKQCLSQRGYLVRN